MMDGSGHSFAEVVHAVLADMEALIQHGEYPVTPGSPWPSELLAVIAVARHHGVRAIVEGGTFEGQSAWAFATFTRVTVYTFDTDGAAVHRARQRFAAAGLMGNAVRIVADHADAFLEIPRLAEALERDGCPFGVFLDGPKGAPALPLVQQLLEMSLANLDFIAVHDTYSSTPGRPNPIRAGLYELGTYTPRWREWSTDGPGWDDARALDVGLYAAHRRMPHGWEPHTHYIHGVPHHNPSYGPTVTVLERTDL